MSIEYLKLFLRFNEQNENIDWNVENPSRNNMTATRENNTALQKIYEVFDAMLKVDKKLAPLPSSTLPLEELLPSNMICQHKFYWENQNSLERHEVFRFSKSHIQTGLGSFVLVNVYPLPSVVSPFFFYFLFGFILTLFETSELTDSYGFLQQEGSDFLINDKVMRSFFYDDLVLSGKTGESYGIARS